MDPPMPPSAMTTKPQTLSATPTPCPAPARTVSTPILSPITAQSHHRVSARCDREFRRMPWAIHLIPGIFRRSLRRCGAGTRDPPRAAAFPNPASPPGTRRTPALRPRAGKSIPPAPETDPPTAAWCSLQKYANRAPVVLRKAAVPVPDRREIFRIPLIPALLAARSAGPLPVVPPITPYP